MREDKTARIAWSIVRKSMVTFDRFVKPTHRLHTRQNATGRATYPRYHATGVGTTHHLLCIRSIVLAHPVIPIYDRFDPFLAVEFVSFAFSSLESPMSSMIIAYD